LTPWPVDKGQSVLRIGLYLSQIHAKYGVVVVYVKQAFPAVIILTTAIAACGAFDQPGGGATTEAPTSVTLPMLIRHTQPAGSTTEKTITAKFVGKFVQGAATTGSTSFDLSGSNTYTPPGDAVVSTTAVGLRPGQWRITMQSSLSGVVTCDPVTLPYAGLSFNVEFEKGKLVTKQCH
jgi:hypothetical protein